MGDAIKSEVGTEEDVANVAAQAAAEEKVELSAEQYNALMDRLEELESSAKAPKNQIDALAEEGRTRRKDEEVQAPVNLDELTNTQLAQFLVQANRQDNQRLVQEIETQKVLREIDKCEVKHEDFWDYKDEVHKTASENPTLTIEQAYQLAKGNNPKPEKSEDGKASRTVTEKLLNLPSRKVLGEKPGVASSSTKVANKDMSTKEAAEMAWDEITKGK